MTLSRIYSIVHKNNGFQFAWISLSLELILIQDTFSLYMCEIWRTRQDCSFSPIQYFLLSFILKICAVSGITVGRRIISHYIQHLLYIFLNNRKWKWRYIFVSLCPVVLSDTWEDCTEHRHLPALNTSDYCHDEKVVTNYKRIF